MDQTGQPSDFRDLGPLGWLSVGIIVIALGMLLYFLSQRGLTGQPSITAQSSSPNSVNQTGPRNRTQPSDSPVRSSSPSRDQSQSASSNSEVYRDPSSSRARPNERSAGRSSSGSSAPSERSSPNYRQASRLVNVFAGKGSEKTDRFTVSRTWTLEWEARGSIFQVFLKGEDGNLRKIAVNRSGMGPGGHSGTVTLETTGTFRLNVNALSTWRIRVIQGQP